MSSNNLSISSKLLNLCHRQITLASSCVCVCGLSCSMWDLITGPGIDPGLLHWERSVLATGPSRKSHHNILLIFVASVMIVHFPFLIVIICVFSLFILVSLPRVLSKINLFSQFSVILISSLYCFIPSAFFGLNLLFVSKVEF